MKHHHLNHHHHYILKRYQDTLSLILTVTHKHIKMSHALYSSPTFPLTVTLPSSTKLYVYLADF